MGGSVGLRWRGRWGLGTAQAPGAGGGLALFNARTPPRRCSPANWCARVLGQQVVADCASSGPLRATRAKPPPAPGACARLHPGDQDDPGHRRGGRTRAGGGVHLQGPGKPVDRREGIGASRRSVVGGAEMVRKRSRPAYKARGARVTLGLGPSPWPHHGPTHPDGEFRDPCPRAIRGRGNEVHVARFRSTDPMYGSEARFRGTDPRYGSEVRIRGTDPRHGSDGSVSGCGECANAATPPRRSSAASGSKAGEPARASAASGCPCPGRSRPRGSEPGPVARDRARAARPRAPDPGPPPTAPPRTPPSRARHPCRP